MTHRGEVVNHDLPPALFTNDIEIVSNAVISGQAIAKLPGVSAAHLICEGRLIPLLNLCVDYGSRTRNPKVSVLF